MNLEEERIEMKNPNCTSKRSVQYPLNIGLTTVEQYVTYLSSDFHLDLLTCCLMNCSLRMLCRVYISVENSVTKPWNPLLLQLYILQQLSQLNTFLRKPKIFLPPFLQAGIFLRELELWFQIYKTFHVPCYTVEYFEMCKKFTQNFKSERNLRKNFKQFLTLSFKIPISSVLYYRCSKDPKIERIPAICPLPFLN